MKKNSVRYYASFNTLLFFVVLEGRCLAYEAKGDDSYYRNEGRRIPQNVMTTDPSKLVRDRTLYYTMDPIPEDHYFHMIVSNISKNTCLSIKRLTTVYLDQSDISDLVCDLHSLNLRSDPEELVDEGYKAIFTCLGKLYEHVRMDRDQYVDIFWDNIQPSELQRFSRDPDTTTQGLPYNYDSCMRFKNDAYSKSNLPTVLQKNFNFDMDLFDGIKWPSVQDYLDISLTYCGTETALSPAVSHKAKIDELIIEWGDSKYKPTSFSSDSTCRLLCRPTIPYLTLSSSHSETTKSVTLAHLLPGSVCRVQIRAIFNPAMVDQGKVYSFETLSTPPSKAPANVRVVRNLETEVTVAWDPVRCMYQNGKLLRFFVVYGEAKKGAKLERTTLHIANPEITLRGLRRHISYQIQVAALNIAGAGPFSPTMTFTTTVPRPGRVVVKSTVSTDTSVIISWMPPVDENHEPYKVRLKYWYKSELKPTVPVHYRVLSCTSWTVKGLKSDMPVSFSLRGINSLGVKGPPTHVTVRTKKR